MHYRIMLSFYGLIFATAVMATQAQAVSLGKIDVASHLGEPFYAEVPLALDDGEEISSMYVELASPADYRILEVYRDQALNSVRADVENDSRGARVELSSKGSIDSPFFNLILKVRYGRATHYKKYPVFLDLPKSTQPQAKAAPLPTISAEQAAVTGPVATVPVAAEMAEAQMQPTAEMAVSSFKPFDGWARTGHYGPMVYGDTISTVADRLRIDSRYTRNQVMVAIFEKNRSKFDQDNINLIKAGTHLDIPQADEVERIRPEQAREIMQDHNRRWHELMKQPRYAAVAEAQKNRYSKRVRAGSASGVAAMPVSGEGEEPVGEGEGTGMPSVAPVQQLERNGAPEGAMSGKSEAELTALNESVSRLEQENEALKAKLAESDAKVAELAAKAGKEDVQTAAEARVKKLELQLARLQAELDTAKQSGGASGGPDWLMLLGGGIVLLLLGGGAGYLLRRERAHPAMAAAPDYVTPSSFEQQMPVQPAVSEVEVEEIDVEPLEDFSPEVSGQSEIEDFGEAFTDSIPDLTDEETGEMEAFREESEEEPDPNVDYLSEADVYMRYGMEDEAEKQVQMALKLRDNNKDAHVKLVQIRKARGDARGADEAISTARMVLAGDTLSNFESTIANLSTGGSEAEDVSLEDTIPPGGLDVSADAQAMESLDDLSDLAGLGEIEFEQEVTEAPAAAPEEAETMELGDLDFPILEEEAGEIEAVEPGEIPVETASVETEATVEFQGDDGLDFDLSGLEIPDEEVEAPAAEPESELLAGGIEQEMVIETPAKEGLESMDDDGLNLSDIDLTQESPVEMAEVPSAEQEEELQTADLDKTLVMDWSKDTVTSGDYEVGGESGAGVADLTFEEFPSETEEQVVESVESVAAESALVEAAAEAQEPEEHLTSVEFDLEDLDVDLEAKVSSDDVDDFSSTIQTSTAEIEASSADLGEEAPGSAGPEAKTAADEESFDLGLGDEKTFEPEEFDHDATVRINVDSLSLEELMNRSSDKDYDSTLELDSLLNELGKDEDSDDSSKKG